MAEQMTTERTWLDAPSIAITTKLGPATLILTSGRTVYVDANKHSGSNPAIGLTVRGVRYGVSAHLVKIEGLWVLSSDRGNPYTGRADHAGWAQASTSARKAIEDAILDAVRTRLATPEGEALLARAEFRSINNDLIRAEEEREKATRAVLAVNERLADLERRLAALPPSAQEG